MLKIYGAGDDLVLANVELQKECPHCGAEVEKPKTAVVAEAEDEIGAYEQAVVFTVGDPAQVVVEMSYVHPGVWAARVQQVDEDVPFPWDVSIKTDPNARPDGCGHSLVVLVDCPNGTPVSVEQKE